MMGSESEQRRAFSLWLRTGRGPAMRRDGGIECKSNPWHDPHTGRFTFANGGEGQTGGWGDGGFSGGGGGSFGGAGATGYWDWPSKRARTTSGPARHSRSLSKPAPARAGPTLPTAAGASPRATPQFHSEVRNGYTYDIDRDGRTRHVSGTLTLADTPIRSRQAQKRAGGADRRPGDDGGHYIAARFKGPTEAFNHFAQDANFNRGAYRALEDTWAAEKRAGKTVSVSMTPSYDGISKRPASIAISYTINGRRYGRDIPNEPKDKRHGK